MPVLDFSPLYGTKNVDYETITDSTRAETRTQNQTIRRQTRAQERRVGFSSY
jgi:hypothetical protein